jgi:putative ABC transport system permease protein
VTWLETLRTSLDAVRSHRLRSTLTMLGIMIGIAAVTLTFGLGQGARNKVNAQINALGTNLLTITPGSSTSSKGIRGGLGTGTTLTVGDARSLESKAVAPDVSMVAPEVQSTSVITFGSSNWTAPVIGTTPSWGTIRKRYASQGRFIDRADLEREAAVAVLGPTVVKQLFRGEDPLGQTVRIDGLSATVIGVLNAVSTPTTSSTTSQDDEVVVPLTTEVERVAYSASLSGILVEARSTAVLSAAYQESDADLLALDGTKTPRRAGFTISTPQALVSTAGSVNKTLADLLDGIAGIALLVGGIGVMNVMLMSVTERVREIGLRKALGATPRLIRRQFLLEAALLGLGGGALGLAVGAVGSLVLPSIVGDPFALSLEATGVALGVAIVIGVLFGVYPAARAARLAPIDALRSE